LDDDQEFRAADLQDEVILDDMRSLRQPARDCFEPPRNELTGLERR